MTTTVRSRLARGAVAVVATILAGTAMTACAASAGDLARASCAHVNKSLALYDKATRSTDPAAARTLKSQAYIELLAGIPIAAQAASHDIQWESLSTTLSEANRVPEATLIPALRSQCRNADTSVFGQVPPPSSPSGSQGSVTTGT